MNETGAMTLTEFLLARIAEDEAKARSVDAKVREFCGATGSIVEPGSDGGRWVDHLTYPTSRVLAECEAKRQVIDASWADLEQIEGEWGRGRSKAQMESQDVYPEAVIALAKVYADHPNYLSEWCI